MGPRAGLDRCGKSRPHRDSIPETVQPVASRYTDYATRPTLYNLIHSNSFPILVHLTTSVFSYTIQPGSLQSYKMEVLPNNLHMFNIYFVTYAHIT